MELIYRDEYFIAVNKPSGFHVHPHENVQHRVSRDKICLYHARRMMKQHVYPVHRLDAATSGVLLFALSSESASRICKLFSERSPQKTYQAVVRGYVKESDKIDIPLELDSTGDLVEASTSYRRLGTKEFPIAVGKRFPTARYSLIEATPHTGRYHQIRRHFNRISHPLLGDAVHGDSHHNRFFRNEVGIEGLCLKALKLEFTHPWSGENVSITAPDCEKWNKIQDLFRV
ncbi:pseudouridine synthase [Bdellovibrio reynosensis]|uniref:tRNA pseudouridine synthase C n=1 Tax=Bdellovibrio reynosensis TaxID=2835041 RepID=A0ABY4CFE1_9BACT|nr:pseudouridine synthase [Bdellovibrio reynosensis]UOF02386.1 pseudouridine synthase [Bdellovibrio reynosensis]